MLPGPLRSAAGADGLQPEVPGDFAFVPHADYLIIDSNFCQALVANSNPRPRRIHAEENHGRTERQRPKSRKGRGCHDFSKQSGQGGIRRQGFAVH